MKSIRFYLFALLSLLWLGSCSESDMRVAHGSPYTLTGTLWQDSATVDSTVILIIDRHESYCTLKGDTLPAFEEVVLPVVEGHFSYQGQVPMDADELYLYDQHNHVVRLYGLSGARLEIKIDQQGEVQQSAIDTTALLRTLLLRDSIPFLKDSLQIRRTLGGIPEESKPEWLMKSIDQMFNLNYRKLGSNYRLPRINLALPDTTYLLPHNKSEWLFLYFWSDQNQASVDSLQIFKAIARDYGLYEYAEKFEKNKDKSRRPAAHRIALFSLCLHAADSASWSEKVKGIPGRHALLEGGYAHPLASSCQVGKLPWIVLMDRFGNYDSHDVWGEALYKRLDKAPLNSDINRRLKLVK